MTKQLSIALLLLLLSHLSCVRLCATPQTAAHQLPSLGFSRQEHWSGLPFPSSMHESEKWKWSRSVLSDPQRPHGLQPTRLLHPWDFPGRSTGVRCHCLLHRIDLEIVILSEVRQRKINITLIAYMWSLKKGYKWIYLQNRSRVTDVENKLTVIRR